MKLIPISEHPDHAKILYDLLAERTPEQSISHKRMPTWEEHCLFLDDYYRRGSSDAAYMAAYRDWRLIDADDRIVGCVYLTHRDEIGVSIFGSEQRKGYGAAAAQKLMDFWRGGLTAPKRFLANINPANEASRKMFEKLGFKIIQHTYALEAE